MGLGKLGVGTLILTGTNTDTGNTSISGGTLEIGGSTGQLAGGAYAGAIAITAGTLRFNTAASQTLSGPITQTGSLVKDGAGTLTLTSAASSGSGSTTVNAAPPSSRTPSTPSAATSPSARRAPLCSLPRSAEA